MGLKTRQLNLGFLAPLERYWANEWAPLFLLLTLALTLRTQVNEARLEQLLNRCSKCGSWLISGWCGLLKEEAG